MGLATGAARRGAEFVVEVAREALATLPIDPEQGLSHGILQRSDGRDPGGDPGARLFQGLIYLSPITEDELFSTKEFSARNQDRKVLFLHGGRDQRIPRSLVERTAGFLKRLGFNVRLKMYDEEDHYVLFSQPEVVLGEIMEWMTEHSGPRPSS